MSFASYCEAYEAKPISTTQEDMDVYWKQIHDLDEQGMLPDLAQQLQYFVYTIKAGGICGHKSVVLSSTNIHFVTVELSFYSKNGENHVSPTTKALATKYKSKLIYHGTVTSTRNQLINTALDVMKKFGSYNQICRNCHDYCRMFLNAIGLSK